jgi:hypothetical protein
MVGWLNGWMVEWLDGWWGNFEIAGFAPGAPGAKIKRHNF